ncbi:MAG: phenylalanine--tRNA ligase subunit alpha [Candidatus Euphemobacter frigidus]|nr:phenylalanine--tRNA ligase subunit alpha [Candidatus Euphemobacter frigidus]MDP8274835.1 phenylalanine--tRNA ligase subunit alpha [Candidatus Euphemobacter frigidus]
MEEKLRNIAREAQGELDGVDNLVNLEALRTAYLGRKGRLIYLIRSIGKLPPDKRPRMGKMANRLKVELQSSFDYVKDNLLEREREKKIREEAIDVTLPGISFHRGRRHPITATLDEIIDIFSGLGFKLEKGPEIESEYNNFDALNMSADHPARDMHDTLYLRPGVLLRTHTSPVQIRTMKKQKPPLRMICAGKSFRADTADASHSPMFHQLEGLMVDRNVTLADLKGILTRFVHQFFGEKIKLRFRPSFFPFTEPSAEVDISCVVCNGEGCPLCSQRGWLEILGAGMVDPEVFKEVGYDAERYTGFAFGMGIERIAMLKYGINDIRLFFENDLRFLHQF